MMSIRHPGSMRDRSMSAETLTSTSIAQRKRLGQAPKFFQASAVRVDGPNEDQQRCALSSITLNIMLCHNVAELGLAKRRLSDIDGFRGLNGAEAPEKQAPSGYPPGSYG